MSMQNKIDIHEFSTGIQVKVTPNGWESGGFTGEYMNRTIDKIPQAVLDSIANREFALAEGVASADPAIVGRIVRGDGGFWSVVAVVTRGRDDRGRGVSLYRYFMCQGDRGIETILRWMGNTPLVFNPFDKREIGQPHQLIPSPAPEEDLLRNFQEETKQSPPIVISAKKLCMPLILDKMTRKLKEENKLNGDRSWAYKVAMLERPEYFQVIYPADDQQAETVIREVLNRRRSLPVLTSGESGIKTAIKAVMNGKVKREHIQTLENALGNPQLDDKYWRTILDKEGASQAVRENIYGDRFVRLLTLKAMLIPQFLRDFLAWLANSKESETHYATSLKFQESILQEAPKFTNDFPKLSEFLKLGICRVISRLIDEPKIFKESNLLLTSQSGLWSKVYPSFSEELEKVIATMGSYIEQKQSWHSLKKKYSQWSSLLDKINKFWYPPEQHDPNYRNLTRLFGKLGTPKLAAIFYQIGEGSVPKSLFFNVSSDPLPKGSIARSKVAYQKRESKQVLGMKINRRKNLGDRAKELRDELDFFFCGTVNIGGIKMQRSIIALMILLLVFTFGRLSVQLDPVIVRLLSRVAQNNNRSNDGDQQSISSGNNDNSNNSSNNNTSNNNSSNNNDNGQAETNQEETPKNLLSETNKFKYENTDDAIDRIKNLLTYKIGELAEDNALEQLNIPKEFYTDLQKINNEGIVIHCIKEIIDLKDFQYSKITEDDTKWEEFSNAIKEYQKRKGARGRNADGVISPEGKTQKQLEQDIRNQCLEL